jgi:hypothetical protein
MNGDHGRIGEPLGAHGSFKAPSTACSSGTSFCASLYKRIFPKCLWLVPLVHTAAAAVCVCLLLPVGSQAGARGRRRARQAEARFHQCVRGAGGERLLFAGEAQVVLERKVVQLACTPSEIQRASEALRGGAAGSPRRRSGAHQREPAGPGARRGCRSQAGAAPCAREGE